MKSLLKVHYYWKEWKHNTKQRMINIEIWFSLDNHKNHECQVEITRRILCLNKTRWQGNFMLCRPNSFKIMLTNLIFSRKSKWCIQTDPMVRHFQRCSMIKKWVFQNKKEENTLRTIFFMVYLKWDWLLFLYWLCQKVNSLMLHGLHRKILNQVVTFGYAFIWPCIYFTSYDVLPLYANG